MNLIMVQPKNETEDLLLSITKNCETFFKQTHTKAEETLEFKLAKSRETISFKPPTSIEASWMIGLTSLDTYNSIFKKAHENNQFQLFTDTFDEFSFEKLKDELEDVLSISDITPAHLEHEKKVRVLSKHITKKDQKNQALVVIL